ncbi:hypothetical protein [Microbacterium sp. BDGP8]|uniref:DUF7426 family protein n=1 Tax=Microbacterium sp. BDGP8 TaxID=3035531 RepID=UPI00249F15EC|nr:hypothetical protein [Microbacterium sp. BDGP8]WHE35149.1 hypothetical protein P6897_10620 [Microbacterium sp. BDGP8]
MTVSGAVDFAQWAAPDLVLTLGERVYNVVPPSVEQARKVIALAARGEVNLRIVRGKIPEAAQQVLATIGPLERPGLGDAAAQMMADGIPVETIDRMHYYAIFYWTRGKEYADALAVALWAPRADAPDGGDGPAPKARARSPRRSGRNTA